jgi:hypothetical protein
MLPSITTYGHTNATNAMRVDIGEDTIWFSYRTPIAFQVGWNGVVVRQNDWGSTTGRHLNAIDGGDPDAKRRRLPGPEFEHQIQAMFRTLTRPEETPAK